MSIFNRFAKDESGATAIEYGLIAALVSVAIIAVLGTLGNNLNATFQSVCRPAGHDAAADPDPIGAGRRRHLRPPMPHPIAGGASWTIIEKKQSREQITDFLGSRRWFARTLRLAAATDGGTSIEYALLAGLIAMVILGGSATSARPWSRCPCRH